MRTCIHCQGRQLSLAQIERLQDWIDRYPHWSRTRLAEQLARRWQWRSASGQFKSFAARSLLLKLEQRHGLRLPPVQQALRRANPWGVVASCGPVLPQREAERIEEPLAKLRPLSFQVVRRGQPLWPQVQAYLQSHHYLSLNRPVGEHLAYLVQDQQQRDLAVVLFGAAAWQCAPRDRFIGWTSLERKRSLAAVVNNSRFLILPTVAVSHLASHVLARITRQLCGDWQTHYGHRIWLVESFVECPRFAGTLYRAANWSYLGQSTGRSRQSRDHRIHGPPKAVFVYPLHRHFREHLQGGRAL